MLSSSSAAARGSPGFVLALGTSVTAHVAVAALILVGLRRGPPSADVGDPAPLLAGDTFELPAPEAEAVPLANASPSESTSPTEAPSASDDAADAPARPTPPRRPTRAAERASHEKRPSGGRASHGSGTAAEPSAGEGLFGAVGDRSATDIATAITRGFAHAASGNPAWKTVPLGPAGEATLTLEIDEAGRLVSSHVDGSPHPTFAAGIRSTLALVNARTFVAQKRVTRLHLVAHVSADEVHDGLHGDVFAIGPGGFTGNEGRSFFALNIGRRIDLRVRRR